MAEADTFSETVNFRRLASQLRKDDYTNVPERTQLLEAAKRVGEATLERWVLQQIQRNEGNFHAVLAYHLMDVGEC